MGGTLTGHLVVDGMSVDGTESSISTDDPAKELMLTTGDRDFRKSGGYLALYGREHNYYNGGFSLSARNADFTESKNNDHSLIGNAAGNLMWENQEIERVASSGTNFIRFASGLQICFGYTTDDATNGLRVTFQAPFFGAPNIVTQYWADNATAQTSYVRLPKASGFTLRCTSNNYVHWIAIGFWK